MGKQIGWFDVLREDGGPTWYGENRTPVVVDPTLVGIVVAFGILLVAFLIILPGIRRERWSSFLSVVVTLFVGAIILVCIYYPRWHEGSVRVFAAFKSFTAERIDAFLGVRVGLNFVNITLSMKSMVQELQNGLNKGLPYPILTVIEYLSVDRGAFLWGRQYRLAGYYTCILMWLSFAVWLLQVAMICLVPHYFSRILMCVGVLLWLSDFVYVMSCPKDMIIHFPQLDGSKTGILELHLSWCFWLALAAGTVCVLFGLVVRIFEVKFHYHFTTFLQADFDEVERSSAAAAGGQQRQQAVSSMRTLRTASGTRLAYRPELDGELEQASRRRRDRFASTLTPLPSPAVAELQQQPRSREARYFLFDEQQTTAAEATSSTHM